MHEFKEELRWRHPPKVLAIPSLFKLSSPGPRIGENKYTFNPLERNIWYTARRSKTKVMIRLHGHDLNGSYPNFCSSKSYPDRADFFFVPVRIRKPRGKHREGRIEVREVRSVTPARVKKKFQCTPYSPTCSCAHTLGYEDLVIASTN